MTIAFTILRIILIKLRFYFTRPSWLSEVASGVATLCWGLLAVRINESGDWPSIELFLQISNSSIWGLIAIFLGLGQVFLFQFIDNRWRRPWLRWTAAVIIAWIWGAITVSSVRADPVPPGAGAYAGWWFVNIYLIGRIFWARA